MCAGRSPDPPSPGTLRSPGKEVRWGRAEGGAPCSVQFPRQAGSRWIRRRVVSPGVLTVLLHGNERAQGLNGGRRMGLGLGDGAWLEPEILYIGA